MNKEELEKRLEMFNKVGIRKLNEEGKQTLIDLQQEYILILRGKE